MRVERDPVLFGGDGGVVTLSVTGGSTVSYGRSRSSTPNSLTLGSSAVLEGPAWVVSQGVFSEVTAAQTQRFLHAGDTSIFVGPVDPAGAAQDGDVWIDTSGA